MYRFIVVALFIMLAGVAQADVRGMKVTSDGAGFPLGINTAGTPNWETAVSSVSQAVLVNYSAEFASLHQDEIDSVYNLSTSFILWTSASEASASSGMTASLSTHDITVGPTGVFDIFLHSSYLGTSGDTIELGVFLNGTTLIDGITRSMAKGPERFPTFINLSAGATFDTFSTVDRLTAADSDLIIVNEGTGTPGFLITLGFINVNTPASVIFPNVGYDGSIGHLVEAQAWNYTLVQWDDMRATTDDFPSTGTYSATTAYLREFNFPGNPADYVDASGNVLVRLNHTSSGTGSHDMILDKVALIDGFSGAAVATKSIEALNSGDIISVKIKNGVDGIATIQHMSLEIIRQGL